MFYKNNTPRKWRMRHTSYVIQGWYLLFFSVIAFAEQFESAAHYQVCFTPYQSCTTQIVNAIQQSRRSIYMQAYSFTSKPILAALLAAKKRNIEVKVILDKSHLNRPMTAKSLVQAHIPVWIDSPPGIAHSKVIIIDGIKVLTGSFNFSYAGQYKNHENVLFIHDKRLAHQYIKNWNYCQLKSKPFLAPSKKISSSASNNFQKVFLSMTGFFITIIIFVWVNNL